MNQQPIDLSAYFTLVKVSISRFGNSKGQKLLAAEMESSKGATVGKALKVSKTKLNPDFLSTINTIANKISSTHRELTATWEEGSYRLLPTSKWLEYTNAIQPLLVQFEAGADGLAMNFDDMLLEAQGRLGSLFDREDYPDTASDFRATFKATSDPKPLEQASDVNRIKTLPIEVVSQIEASMTRTIQENLNRVQSENFQRLYDVAGKLKNSLESYASGNQSTVKATLLESIEKACSYCSGFNVTNDPTLVSLIEDMRNDLTKYDMEDVRNDPSKLVELSSAASKAAERAAKRANIAGYMQ